MVWPGESISTPTLISSHTHSLPTPLQCLWPEPRSWPSAPLCSPENQTPSSNNLFWLAQCGLFERDGITLLITQPQALSNTGSIPNHTTDSEPFQHLARCWILLLVWLLFFLTSKGSHDASLAKAACGGVNVLTCASGNDLQVFLQGNTPHAGIFNGYWGSAQGRLVLDWLI